MNLLRAVLLLMTAPRPPNRGDLPPIAPCAWCGETDAAWHDSFENYTCDPCRETMRKATPWENDCRFAEFPEIKRRLKQRFPRAYDWERDQWTPGRRP